MKKKYPINEGWYHLTANLKAGATLTEMQMLRLIGLTPDTAEVAVFRHTKTRATIIARKKEVKND